MKTPTRSAVSLLAVLLAAGCAAAGVVRQDEEHRPGDRQEAAVNVRFGMPAPAAKDPDNREAYLIDRPQYTLSYNGKTKTANWVCWRLTKGDLGKSKRGPFKPDPRLPKGFTQITTQVYTGSGFDRGHMCPAQDRSARQEDMDATFRMTNIVPQSPNSNRHGWERLEDYCRRLANQGRVLYIACGPAGIGGEGTNGPAEEIGKGRMKVAVPAKLWKVILVVPDEDAEPRRNSRVIAVIMPNDQSVGYDWTEHRTSARDVEKLTGFRFFRNVPDEVADALRAHVDDVKVRVSRPKRGVE
jgi:endonuclease G